MDGGRERGGTRMRCVCMRMDCLQTQINVNKKQKRKNLLMGRGGRQSVFLRVHADVDGGRGRVGTRTRCVCVRMDCLRTQISVNKKQKRKNLLMGSGHSVRTRMGNVDTLCACG